MGQFLDGSLQLATGCGSVLEGPLKGLKGFYFLCSPPEVR
jgi:hypothetical protein